MTEAKFKVGDRVRYVPDTYDYPELKPDVVITKVDGFRYYYIRRDDGNEGTFTNERVFDKVPCNNWKEKMLL